MPSAFCGCRDKGVAIRQKTERHPVPYTDLPLPLHSSDAEMPDFQARQVHFNRDKLAVHINVFDACRETDLFNLSM